MAEKFELKIIKPDGMFFDGQSDFLEFVSTEGEMGVYANHIPLTTILDAGVVKIHNGNEVKKAAVTGGFLEILQDRITMLAEDAQWPEDIDVERAKEAKRRAEERLQKKESGMDMVRAEAALKRAMARIRATK